MAKAFGFKKANADGILREYRSGKRTAAPTRGGAGIKIRHPTVRKWVAVVTSEISARSSNTPGTGTVTLKTEDANGDFSDLKTGVTVRNWTATAVAVDKWINVGTFLGLKGKWATNEDCT
jgi:hypothetical protein